MRPDRPRRVAKLATDFLSGSETFIHDEVEAHQRYQVEVLTLRRQNQDRFPVSVPVHALTPGRGISGAIEAGLCRTTTISPTFQRLCQARAYDLIHAHFGTGGVYALPYRRIPRRPLVVTFHGHEVPLLASARRFEPKHWGYWILSKWLLRRADRLLAVSPTMVGQLVSLGAPAARVHLFDLGIRLPPTYSPDRPDGPFQALMVGRFVEKKGMAYGIHAFAKAAAGTTARLRIIGDGPLRSALEKVIADCGTSTQIELSGELHHAEVLNFLRQSHLLLAPSVVAKNGDREGTPTVIKEAGAYGLPTVATRHAGIPRQIEDGISGFLVPERDVDALAEKIRVLIADNDLRRRMGHAARRLVEERFDLTKQIMVLEQHYDEVLAPRDREPKDVT